jgi:hypothetical protein
MQVPKFFKAQLHHGWYPLRTTLQVYSPQLAHFRAFRIESCTASASCRDLRGRGEGHNRQPKILQRTNRSQEIRILHRLGDE